MREEEGRTTDGEESVREREGGGEGDREGGGREAGWGERLMEKRVREREGGGR